MRSNQNLAGSSNGRVAGKLRMSAMPLEWLDAGSWRLPSGKALAEFALQEAKRKMLLERQKELSRAGHQILRNWIEEQNGAFSIVEPAATSTAFVRYHFDVPSCELADHIRKKSSVLVAPGALLGAEHHLRIAVGIDTDKLKIALDRIGASVCELAA